MRSLSLFLLAFATLAAVLPAAAQTAPRRPPSDTVRFGATRPAAGDSIRMAEYDEADEDAQSADVARADDDEESASAEDTVPPKPRDGPYARARGTGPFTVQASGETAARPARGEVVWVQGRAPARRDTASARRDTAASGGQRVASGQGARRDTASASGNRPARRDTASAAANRPARRDTASTASRPAARDTAGARRNGQSASTSTTSGRTGSPSTSTTTSGRNGTTTSTSTSGRNGTTTTTSTNGRTGSASTSSSSTSGGARARSHTVASGETFYAIARRYGVTAAQLRALNPDVEMDDLEIGDVLRLPASARDSRAGGSASSGSGASAGSQGRTGSQTQPRQGAQGQRRSHTVAAGETLFGIARRYGVTVDAIREANDLEGDGLRTGQRLVIPPAR